MPSADRLPTIDLDDERWRSRFVRTAESSTPGERKALARLSESGDLLRIRRGVYASPGDRSDRDELFRDAIRAYHLEHPRAVFTHRSAAALWRLPRIGRSPGFVEILGPDTGGGRSGAGVLQRRESVPAATTIIEGIPVTSLARTVVDLARVDSVASSVAAMDAALRGIRSIDGRVFRTEKDALRALVELFPGSRGLAQAAWVIDFADGRAEKAGESLSRLQIHRLGLTSPQLQVAFVDDEGLMEPDFYWEEFEVAGEFDGFGKYLLADPDPARSVVRAVMSEKRREDRLRRQPRVRGVARWDWATANDRPALGVLLRRAGVR